MKNLKFNLDYILWIAAIFLFIFVVAFSLSSVLFLLNNVKNTLSNNNFSNTEPIKFKIPELKKILETNR